MKKIFIIGIGGIGISAVARYYNNIGYKVSGSDKCDSELLKKMELEGIKIYIGHNAKNLDKNTNLVIYSGAIITEADLTKEKNLITNPELNKAKKLGIKNISYPEALAEIVNSKKLIAVCGTHGKSTTTSMIGWILKDSKFDSSVIVGTQVKQLNNSNFYFGKSDYFVIEACEYKRSFLKYNPYITVITNIEIDHLDYYKDLKDYISAFKQFQNQTNGIIVLNGDDKNCLKLKNNKKKQIWINSEFYKNNKLLNGKLNLKIPGKHIEFDAYLAFAVTKLIGLDDNYIIKKLNSYNGAWRRSEIIKTTKFGNILMSDYGHHPTEINLTLQAIKEKYFDKKLFVIFQPHQYSRTIELLRGFKKCFDFADKIIISDIYFSRDKQEDVLIMPPEKFVKELNKNYKNIAYGDGLKNTLKLIKEYDKKNSKSSIILLLGAGNIDELRYKIN